MTASKISIVVPIYKVEKEIHRCVESLLAQTLKDIEIILVDDGSPDNCPIICDDYAKKDNRIKVIHKENGGLSDARNVGLLEAKAEYVLFVDSDDYIDKDTCEKFYNSIEADEDIIVGDAVRVEGEKESLMGHADVAIESAISGSEFLREQLRSKKMYMAACLNLYNREFLINNDLFFKKGILHEDEQWTPRVFLKAKKVKYIKFPFYYYIIRENSITKKKDKTKNAVDLMNSIKELSIIYDDLTDKQLKQLLNNYLVMLYLNGFYIGKLYRKGFEEFIDKDFLKARAISRKNLLKVKLFCFNPKAYYLANKLIKFLNFKE